MKGSSFIFNHIHLLYYKRHKVNLNCVGSYIDSPDWIKNKKATINHVNDNDKCFQFAVKVALRHEDGTKLPRNIKDQGFYKQI